VVQVKAAIIDKIHKSGMHTCRKARWDRVKVRSERGRLLGDEEDVYDGRIDLVEVGQRLHAGVGRVDAAVELAAIAKQLYQSAAAKGIESR
jgi:hypothetical protein